MITIKLKGPKNLQTLSSLPEEMQRSLLQGVKDGIELILKTSAKEYMTGPYPEKLSVDTGWLRKGLYGNAWVAGVPGEFIQAEVGNYVSKYAKVHEQYGSLRTTSFPIHAKTDKGMSFFWKRKGIWIRGIKSVYIPARPFLYPAIMACAPKIAKTLDKMIRKAERDAKAKGGP